MRRKDVLNSGYTEEVQRLVRVYPNDMELGRALRKLTQDTNKKIERLDNELKTRSTKSQTSDFIC